MLKFIRHLEHMLSSQSANFQTSVDDMFPELQKGIASTGHIIKTIVPNQTIISEGKHEFNTILMVVLILFCWPGAIIYYFKSKRSILSVIVTRHNETGCTVTINSNGNAGDIMTEYIFSNLKKNDGNLDTV